MKHTIISPEYLIGNLLIANEGKFPITYQMIMELTKLIYDEAEKKDINVCVEAWTKIIDAALYNFSDYFSMDNHKNILINKSKTIDDLEARFIGYLPLDVLLLISECSRTIINNYK